MNQIFYKPYTGVGSRRAPDFALSLMQDVAVYLAGNYYTLRSGHAEGSDIAFERGVDSVYGPKEIYLPWSGFNGARTFVSPPKQSWLEMAERFHPAWSKCSDGGKKLHARNCPQVLGNNLDAPSLFLICWTDRASGIGGTGQALRIARAHSVPIFDIGAYNDYKTAKDMLSNWLRDVM